MEQKKASRQTGIGSMQAEQKDAAKPRRDTILGLDRITAKQLSGAFKDRKHTASVAKEGKQVGERRQPNAGSWKGWRPK